MSGQQDYADSFQISYNAADNITIFFQSQQICKCRVNKDRRAKCVLSRKPTNRLDKSN